MRLRLISASLAALWALAVVGACSDREDDPSAPAMCDQQIVRFCERFVTCLKEEQNIDRSFDECVQTRRTADNCDKAVVVSYPWYNACVDWLERDCLFIYTQDKPAPGDSESTVLSKLRTTPPPPCTQSIGKN